jgi:hypothetical protein
MRFKGWPDEFSSHKTFQGESVSLSKALIGNIGRYTQATDSGCLLPNLIAIQEDMNYNIVIS